MQTTVREETTARECGRTDCFYVPEKGGLTCKRKRDLYFEPICGLR